MYKRQDEGSGRYVDAWALHHYSRWLDGCRPRTLLVEKISAELKIKTRKALMDYSAQKMCIRDRALVLTVIIVALTAVQFKWLGNDVEY